MHSESRAGRVSDPVNSTVISIIIPTHNRREVLVSRTLPAIFAQDFPADDYEVVVVVDGATDGTAEALRAVRPACPLRVIEQPNRGPGPARNNGIQVAKGNLLLFLDDDILCGPRLLRQHAEVHAGADPLVAYGPISISPESPPSVFTFASEKWYRELCNKLDAQGGLHFPHDPFLISNSSLPRATLTAAGGFNEKLSAGEDYELGLRLWKMGVAFKYMPQARVTQYFVKSSHYVVRHEGKSNDGKSMGRSEVIIGRLHPECRPHSELAVLGEIPWRKLFRRRLYVQLPKTPATIFALPLWFCDKLWRFPAMQRTGERLMAVGGNIAELRGAAGEAGSWKALLREYAMRLPALLYHHVGPPRPGTYDGLTISPETFERQMGWLARRGYTGIRPSDWLRWLRCGTGLPDKPILVTFDDGYADIADYALPVLRKYGFSAAVYIVTGQVGGTNAWDEAQGSGTHHLLTAEQIRYWAGQGIEFGAHSRTHADLTKLSASELAAEVSGSKTDLENILGRPVVSFAYPYGNVNQAASDYVRSQFDMAFSTEIGINFLRTDPHLLRRLHISPDDSLADIESYTHTVELQTINQLRARLKVRTRLKSAARIAMRRR